MNLDPETEALYRHVTDSLNRGEAPAVKTVGDLAFALRNHPQSADLMGPINTASQRLTMNDALATARARGIAEHHATMAAAQAQGAAQRSNVMMDNEGEPEFAQGPAQVPQMQPSGTPQAPRPATSPFWNGLGPMWGPGRR